MFEIHLRHKLEAKNCNKVKIFKIYFALSNKNLNYCNHYNSSTNQKLTSVVEYPDNSWWNGKCFGTPSKMCCKRSHCPSFFLNKSKKASTSSGDHLLFCKNFKLIRIYYVDEMSQVIRGGIWGGGVANKFNLKRIN